MKKTSTILALLFSGALASYAQVIIDQSKVPAPGTLFVRYDADAATSFTFSKTGTGNTWDFTTLGTPAKTDTAYYLPASAVLGADSFPEATLAKWETGDVAKYFANTDESGVYFHGLNGDFLNNGYRLTIPLKNTALIQPFPITESSNYENNFSIDHKVKGSAVGYPSVDSGRITVDHYSVATVIASGTINLPSGSYPSILEKVIQTRITILYTKPALLGGSGWGIFPFPIPGTGTVVDTLYNWYTNESAQPYATVVYTDGALVDVLYYKSTLTTGLTEAGKTAAVKCYPNPAKDMLNIEAEKEKIESVTVTNTSGVEVLHETGTNQLNVANLKAGMYIARTRMTNGKVLHSTFIKN